MCRCLCVNQNYALHLQCNNAKTRDQWSYGLMGVLQQAGSMAKLHQESAAANSTANGTPASAEKKKATLLKAQAAASKGSEMAIALGLPALPLPTQKMMGLMFQGKKFIRYPFTAAQNGATLSKVFYRAAMNKLGTLYYAEATAGDNPDLNALTAAGAALPVHLITDIIVGNSSHPSAPVGCAVNAANCLSFIASVSSTTFAQIVALQSYSRCLRVCAVACAATEYGPIPPFGSKRYQTSCCMGKDD